MRAFVCVLVVALIVLHQDFWWWHEARPLVFGFIPIGLAWHVGISLMAALLAGLIVRFCWPAHIDDLESQRGPTNPRRGH